jgi:hypothetical protein
MMWEYQTVDWLVNLKEEAISCGARAGNGHLGHREFPGIMTCYLNE